MNEFRKIPSDPRRKIVMQIKMCSLHIVVTENSVRSENTGVPIIRKIRVATTISSPFVAFLALVASSFRTRATLQAEILAAPGATRIAVPARPGAQFQSARHREIGLISGWILNPRFQPTIRMSITTSYVLRRPPEVT
jgi:hypothetical protein